MAVEDKYVDAEVAASALGEAVNVAGNKLVCIVNTFEVAAADDDGSVYRIAKNLSPDWIPVKIEINNDAITSGTDYDLGFYETSNGWGDGAVIDKDELADGLDMSSGAANGSEKNGMGAVAIENIGKPIYLLCGHTIKTKKPGYDLAFTANTVGAAAGTITTRAWFVQH